MINVSQAVDGAAKQLCTGLGQAGVVCISLFLG